MRVYTASEARAHLADALDSAERGEQVVIARHGRRFRIVADKPVIPKRCQKALFQVTDPRLLEHGWTWEWCAPGEEMRLRTTRRPKRGR